MIKKETVKVALSGLGGYGSFYLERLLDRAGEFGVALVGAVDPMPEACTRLKDLQAHDIPVFPNVDDLFAHQNVDLMIVSSPIHCHAEQSIKAMEAGADVLCEKPAAGSLADAEAMAEASVRTGRFCAIGYQWSFSDAVTQLKQDILAGVFGTPIRFKTLVLWPRPESYYQRCDWAGKTKTADGRWVLDSPVNNACAHFWHNMLFLAGDRPESAGVIDSVHCELYRAKPVESFDTEAIRCGLKNGLEILLYATHSCQATIGPVSTFEFSKAVLDFQAGKGFVARLNKGTVHEYGDPDADGGDMKLKVCLNAIRHATPVPCTIHSAIPHVKGVAALDPDCSATTTFPDDRIVYKKMQDGDTLVAVKGLENNLIQCYANNLLPQQAYPDKPNNKRIFSVIQRRRIAAGVRR